MEVPASPPLALLTTFHIGGPARAFFEVRSEEEIQTAIAFARDSGLPLYVLGAGSNVLVPDAGVAGVVVHMQIAGIAVEESADSIMIIGGAGTLWEEIVDIACSRGVSGIENLAGIPGTLGGAAVQNIGAYGAELSSVFAYADCIDTTTGAVRRVSESEAGFAYRDSFFKAHREFIITRVALRLKKDAQSNIAYADIARARAEGAVLDTPRAIAEVVRRIRARKFPQSSEEGMAGSFFKNPVISRELSLAVQTRFPELPAFPQEDGRVKISLAWLLDHALSLKGYAKGSVRLYEQQPIVVVARAGASAAEVDAFAEEIRTRVFNATGITIEREVETFGAD
ncbi:MAG: UDP-N-acetylmuramate dehydrogenase [Candidatus Paceibacteria bacterium]